MFELSVEEQRKLAAAAKAAASAAYAPYSGLQVGAAITTKPGLQYSGCNVENASYGLSLCAERSAMAAAIASGNLVRGGLAGVALYCGASGTTPPCGACLQWMAEFGAADTQVLLVDDHDMVLFRLADLLPLPFNIAASRDPEVRRRS